MHSKNPFFDFRIRPSLKSEEDSGVSSQLNCALISSCRWTRVVRRPNSTNGFISTLLSWRDTNERIWSIIFIDISSKKTPSDFFWIWIPTFSALSQLISSSLEAVRPVERDHNASIVGSKGLWISSYDMIFSIDFLSCCQRLIVNSTCCSLVLRFTFVRVVMASWIPAHLYMLPIHTTLTESDIPPPLVMPPLVFKERIINFSIMRSVQRPAQNRSLSHHMITFFFETLVDPRVCIIRISHLL